MARRDLAEQVPPAAQPAAANAAEPAAAKAAEPAARPAGAAKAPETKERLTATDRLQRRLEADILTGALPPGMRLKPAALAPAYGVSVTPFREALARLEASGLIELDPFIGARVAPISSAEVEDLFAVRLLLERDALARAIERGDPEWEARLRDAFARLEKASTTLTGGGTAAKTVHWLAVHRDFHWALIAGGDSVWSLRLLENLYDHLDRYQALAWTDEGLRETSMPEHAALFDAYVRRDVEGAVRALELHLESAVRWIVGSIDALVAQGQPEA